MTWKGYSQSYLFRGLLTILFSSKIIKGKLKQVSEMSSFKNKLSKLRKVCFFLEITD